MRKLVTLAAMAVALVFAGAEFVKARTGTVPHVLETSGDSTGAGPFPTFDSFLAFQYSGGIIDQTLTPGSGGATVDIYFFDQFTGLPIVGANGSDVCNPCSLALDENNRKELFSFEAAIQAQGGYPTTGPGSTVPGVILGHGVVVFGGANPEAVTSQGFEVNAVTSAFDLSVFSFDIKTLAATVR